MEAVISKTEKNLIDKYAPNPTLPFDVEGKIVEKNGKNVKIEKSIDGKTFEYSLRLKDEPKAEVGETVEIDKEDIVSYKVEEKKQEIKREENINIQKILRELGLKHTSENVRMIENLLQNGIKVTKGNVDSYIKSKKYLTKIIQDIDMKKTIKLGEMGIRLEEDSLQKIAEALEMIEDEGFSIRKFLKIDKDISYKEAEKISKQVYGRKMGKDVYDSIIALKRENIPITKENIENTLDAIKKIKSLKDIEDRVYIKFIDGESEFSIDNLYKEQNQYTTSSIQSSGDVSIFQNTTIKDQANIDSLKQVLRDIGLEDTLENVVVLREFIYCDIDITVDKYNSFIDMKNAVSELLDIIGENGMSSIVADESNLQENIYSLVGKLKNEDNTRENIEIEDNVEILNDKPKKQDENLKVLQEIEDKELLKLIKSGEDFTLKNILKIKSTDLGVRQVDNPIEYKTVESAQRLVDIFRNLGESLIPEVISKSSNINKEISLESLNIASKQEEVSNSRNIEVLDKEKISFIQREYIRIKNSLTTNVVKWSIMQGKSIEKMPIVELSPYIEKSLEKYRETKKLNQDIKHIEGKQERLIPMIMKNNLDMTLKEIKNIDSFLDGEKNLSNTIDDLLKDENYQKEFKEGIQTLQKNISDGIKNGQHVKEDYDSLINTMLDTNTSSDDKQNETRKDEYLKIKNKISGKDIVFQLPIEIGDEYKTLNVIIPNARDGINKSNMKFFVSLETENIGKINIDIDVKGSEIYMNLGEEKNLLKPKLKELKDDLKSIGYTLIEKDNQVTA